MRLRAAFQRYAQPFSDYGIGRADDAVSYAPLVPVPVSIDVDNDRGRVKIAGTAVCCSMSSFV